VVAAAADGRMEAVHSLRMWTKIIACPQMQSFVFVSLACMCYFMAQEDTRVQRKLYLRKI
jgi:hypothetical protein